MEIERSIRALSLKEQQWLLERITQQVQERIQTADKFADAPYMEEQIKAMADDPDIIAEIAAINDEFGVTELDGLEEVMSIERRILLHCTITPTSRSFDCDRISRIHLHNSFTTQLFYIAIAPFNPIFTHSTSASTVQPKRRNNTTT